MGKKNPLKSLVDARVHCAYYGVTQSGKTTLARMHARLLALSGYDVIVYDPVGTATAGGDWPERCLMIDSPDDLQKRVASFEGETDRPVFLFVDEAPDVFGHTETWARWIPRKIRHQHVYLRLMVTRPNSVHPDVRNQCVVAYVFRLAREDMRLVMADYGFSVGDSQDQLDKGDFLVLESGRASIDKANVFTLLHSRPLSG